MKGRSHYCVVAIVIRGKKKMIRGESEAKQARARAPIYATLISIDRGIRMYARGALSYTTFWKLQATCTRPTVSSV